MRKGHYATATCLSMLSGKSHENASQQVASWLRTGAIDTRTAKSLETILRVAQPANPMRTSRWETWPIGKDGMVKVIAGYPINPPRPNPKTGVMMHYGRFKFPFFQVAVRHKGTGDMDVVQYNAKFGWSIQYGCGVGDRTVEGTIRPGSHETIQGTRVGSRSHMVDILTQRYGKEICEEVLHLIDVESF